MTPNTRIQTDEADSTTGREEGLITRTEATRCDVCGNEDGNFAGFELTHDTEGGGRGQRGEDKGYALKQFRLFSSCKCDAIQVSFPLLLVTVQRAGWPTR